MVAFEEEPTIVDVGGEVVAPMNEFEAKLDAIFSKTSLREQFRELLKYAYKNGFSDGQSSILDNGQIPLFTEQQLDGARRAWADKIIGGDNELVAADDLHPDAYKIQPRIKAMMRQRNKEYK